MALQLNKELPSGIEIAQAYYRIASIEFRKDSFVIGLRIYASQQAAIDIVSIFSDGTDLFGTFGDDYS